PVPTPVGTPVPTPVGTPVPTPVGTPVPTPVVTPEPTPVTTPVGTPVPTPVSEALPATGTPPPTLEGGQVLPRTGSNSVGRHLVWTLTVVGALLAIGGVVLELRRQRLPMKSGGR
ncbi:MAG: hypothetical protein NZ761_02590, partial [Dehalococcoidia bacterium]|nr:hypothetical protein [Dehalococcoidia bacterium]